MIPNEVYVVFNKTKYFNSAFYFLNLFIHSFIFFNLFT